MYSIVYRRFVVSEFFEKFHKHPNYDSSTKDFEMFSDECFDGPWLAAVALDCAINRLQEIGTWFI